MGGKLTCSEWKEGGKELVLWDKNKRNTEYTSVKIMLGEIVIGDMEK